METARRQHKKWFSSYFKSTERAVKKMLLLKIIGMFC